MSVTLKEFGGETTFAAFFEGFELFSWFRLYDHLQFLGDTYVFVGDLNTCVPSLRVSILCM